MIKNSNQPNHNGFTLIEIVVTLGIMVIGLVAITQLFKLYIQIVADEKYRVTASALGNEKLETIRNLPYNQIGTIGGIPAGNLVQTEVVTKNKKDFTIKTEVIYIDDPFDGLITTTGVDNSIYRITNPELTYYWAMESNVNGQVPDVGNGSLTISGVETTEGRIDNGLLYGNNDEIHTTTAGNIDPNVGRIGLWYKPNDSGNSKEYFLHVDTSSGKFEFYRNNNSKMIFTIGSSDLGSDDLTWSAGQWYFLEAAWDKNINYRQIWRNGIPIALNESNFSVPSMGSNFYIGTDDANKYEVDGIIDELFILNNAHAYEIWGYNQSYAYFSVNPQVIFYWGMNSITSPQSPEKGQGEITLGGYIDEVDGAVDKAIDFSDNNRLLWSALPLTGDNIDLEKGRIGFWYKPENQDNDSVLFNAIGCNGYLNLTRLEATDQLQFQYGSLTNNNQITSQALDWDNKFWYFLEAAWYPEKNSMALYRDRTLLATSTLTTLEAPTNCSTLYLGNEDNISFNDAEGVIDEFYILKEPFPYSTVQDTLNTDYKRVKVTVSWSTPYGPKELYTITDIAPPGIETTAGGGTIILHVYDANGSPIEGADIHVYNDTLNPIIDLDLTSGANGRLIIPGAPATSSSYQIIVSKENYSTDYTMSATSTYVNPVRDHLSVIENDVTEISFSIDQTSSIIVNSVSQTLPINWQINTDTSDEDQILPALANSDSFIYVAWSDWRSSTSSQIYLQKYDFNGNKIWSDDRVISPTQNQIDPHLDLDVAENQYIVWSDTSNGNSDIFLAKYTTLGNDAWSGSIKVNGDIGTTNQTNPDIIYANNEAYVVWQDERNDSGDIYFNKFDSFGTKLLGSDIKINTDLGSAKQQLPMLNITSDGNIYIAWLDNRNGNDDIYLNLIDFQGNPVWTNEIKINSALSGNISDFDLAVDNNDNAYISWSDNRNLKFDPYWQAVATSSSLLFGADKNLPTSVPSENQQNLKVKIDNNDDLYFAWQDERSGSLDIYILKTDNQGVLLWPQEVKINVETTNEQSLGDITVYENNKIMATWADYSQGDANVWTGTLNYDGTESVVPFVDFNLTGSKKTHETPDLFKYNKNLVTNSAGELNISNLEWDTYTLTLTDPLFSLIQLEPASPFSIIPGTTTILKLVVD